jgi:acid phosphatase (class A)
MKIFLFLILSINLISCGSHPVQTSTLQATEQNIYISSELYSDFKAQISDFPAPQSALQISDEKELLQKQKTRSQKDCARASSEVVVSLQNFYGPPYGMLTEKQIQFLFPLFERIRNEGGAYIGQIKRGYARPRPYEYIKGLKPCVSKEPTFAYPSGHATLANLYALVLTDLFPDQATELAKRSDQISQDRILAGVHHPTDVAAGKKLGFLIYAELKKSQAYNNDIQKLKK